MASDRDIVQIGEYGKRVGETHGMAKLTDHEVELVRELHRQGMSAEEIAEKMEIHKRYVFALVNFERRASIAVTVKRGRRVKPAPPARKLRPEPESSLLTRIKTELRGSTGQHPVEESALLALGEPEAMRTALRLLACTHGINTAKVTTGGETRTVYWEAGFIGLAARAALAVGTARFYSPFSPRGGREESRNSTLTQGEVMKPNGKGSLIASAIQSAPGMNFDELLAVVQQKLPDLKPSNLSVHFSSLKKANEIEARGSRNKGRYYPAGMAPSESAPAPLAAPAPEPAVPSPTGGGLGRGKPQDNDSAFSLMIHEDNHLHVELDGEPITFSPERTLRLKRFLDRVTLEAA